MRWLLLAITMLIAAGCGSTQQTHYYALALPSGRPPMAPGRGVLSVEELAVAAAYDDQRIVYRKDPYRLDYYEYHQWSAAPSLAISDYVRDALEQSGRFARVSDQRSPDTTLVLRGRIAAFEEVDLSATEWVGRVDLELYLEDPKTSKVVWSKRFREQRPLTVRHPSGLAQALSAALAQIMARATPEISAAAERVERPENATSSLAR
jgi:cholesterol transport system auxiliary component